MKPTRLSMVWHLPRLTGLLAAALGCVAAAAGTFVLPTPNRALFEPDGEERFFAPTAGRPWTSGTFGCVRTEGWQMHEGVDILCVQRDRAGEPLDPVGATADGWVVYTNGRASLSNYGIYVLLRHEVEGLELYSMYAHLARLAEGLHPGQPVRAGQPLGIMGRTTNTREAIARDRAHLHFELNFLLNERFADWYARSNPGQRNDHGVWNGRNFLGLDPRLILVSQHRFPTNFSLRRLVSVQPELCRVAVRDPDFPWVRRYSALVRTELAELRGPLAGFEVHLDYNGIPVRLIPRSADQMPGPARFTLLGVQETEARRNPCRKLVVRDGQGWALGRAGRELLELLTY